MELSQIFAWIKLNWALILPIILSVIAILFTAFKEFILPSFIQPKLSITYLQEAPYKRGPIIKNSGDLIEVFERFKVENIGKEVAKNVRCQIYQIKDSNKKTVDFQGYHLKWASRPETTQDFSKVERINIARGESEFVDLVYMRTDNTTNIYFNKYPNIPSGMNDSIPADNYSFIVIISGDNFKPYLVSFKINKKIDITGVKVILEEVRRI